MLRTKTHFEQVPIEIVRRIVEEQIRREKVLTPSRGRAEKSFELEVWEAPEQPVAKSHPFFRGLENYRESEQKENYEWARQKECRVPSPAEIRQLTPITKKAGRTGLFELGLAVTAHCYLVSAASAAAVLVASEMRAFLPRKPRR